MMKKNFLILASAMLLLTTNVKANNIKDDEKDRDNKTETKNDHFSDSFNDCYGIDNYNVYCNGVKIEGAKPSSFELLKDGYAKDSYTTYYRGVKINESNYYAKTFIVLSKGYAKNDLYVYFEGNIVQGVDLSSFKVLE